MHTQSVLLAIAALVECLTGLSFIVAPGASITGLIGTEPNDAGAMIGQVAGVAPLALGIAVWGARADAGAGLLLTAFAGAGRAGGVVIWIAGVLHIALAIAFLAAQRQRLDSSPAKSQRESKG